MCDCQAGLIKAIITVLIKNEVISEAAWIHRAAPISVSIACSPIPAYTARPWIPGVCCCYSFWLLQRDGQAEWFWVDGYIQRCFITLRRLQTVISGLPSYWRHPPGRPRQSWMQTTEHRPAHGIETSSGSWTVEVAVLQHGACPRWWS